MKVRKFDNNEGQHPIICLKAENTEERAFLKKVWLYGLKAVSYNGVDDLTVTDDTVGSPERKAQPWHPYC